MSAAHRTTAMPFQQWNGANPCGFARLVDIDEGVKRARGGSASRGEETT